MKILLTVFPPFWLNTPPIGIASLKSFLTSNKICTDILDYNCILYRTSDDKLKKEWRKSCNKALEDDIYRLLMSSRKIEIDKMYDVLGSYDTVGFSCFKSNLKMTLKTVEALNKIKPNIKIILGGPEITRQYLNGSLNENSGIPADLFVAGEGELPLYEFLSGKWQGGRIAAFHELDTLCDVAPPDYGDFCPADYIRPDCISIMLSRGCIKKCSFCTERLLYKKLKTFPIKSIIQFMEKCIKNDLKYFIFHDSLINADLKALERLCDAIIDRFGSVPWEAQIGIRKDISLKLLKKMKQSGCYHLFVGLESGSDKTLSIMNKGYKKDTALRFLEKLHKARLSFGVSIITGFPDETEEQFNESLEFIVQHKGIIPKIEQVNPYVYYDWGTDPFKNVDDNISLSRAKRFIERIDREGFKYTRSFMLNLVEKD